MNQALPKKLWDQLGLVSILDTINRLSRIARTAVLSHHRTYGSVYGGSDYAAKPFIVSSIETNPSRSHSLFGST